ncbi:hypothetical protein ACGFIV_00860 [Sphaerisporangium sp. NPDC049003]|uniref:hypothetical protein n=1 Tax=Sphaerisporangium sp. NPDC049003 TaxID=3364517 RepID=UPI0037187733
MSLAPITVSLNIDATKTRQALARLCEQVGTLHARLLDVLHPVAAAMSAAGGQMAERIDRHHVTLWAAGTGPEARRHRRTCARCTPSYRRPLPINGHEYHRRTRTRRKP